MRIVESQDIASKCGGFATLSILTGLQMVSAIAGKIHFDPRPLPYGHLPMVENKCEKEQDTGNPFRTDLEYRGYDKRSSQCICPDLRHMLRLPPLLRPKQEMPSRLSLNASRAL